MGDIGRCLIKTRFLPQNVNGKIYKHFLKNHLLRLLEDISFVNWAVNNTSAGYLPIALIVETTAITECNCVS